MDNPTQRHKVQHFFGWLKRHPIFDAIAISLLAAIFLPPTITLYVWVLAAAVIVFMIAQWVSRKWQSTHGDRSPENTAHSGWRAFFLSNGKELIVALIFAVVVTGVADYYNTQRMNTLIADDQNAVAIVHVFDNSGNEIATGSGFFIDSNGDLVTNLHVIQGGTDFQAEMPSGAFYKFDQVVNTDKADDLAILHFKAYNTPSVSLGDATTLIAGQSVLAIGAPLGIAVSVSKGDVSNPNLSSDGRSVIQFTAPISPGNSGGGLFTDDGKVVGVTEASLNIPSGPQAGSAQNLNIAIPINYVMDLYTNATSTGITEYSSTYYDALGSAADNSNDWADAITDYNQAIQINANDANAYIGLGGDYYEQGDYNDEVANYLEATQVLPTDESAFYYLGTAYEDVGDYTSAIATYKKALQLDPTDKDALHDLILDYLATGDKTGAGALIPKLTTLDQGSGHELESIISNQK
jgi:S1-C subfamily serine protease